MRPLSKIIAVGALLATSSYALPALAGDDDLTQCGYLCTQDGPLLTSGLDHPPPTELVGRIVLGAFSEACSWAIGGPTGSWEPEVHDLVYRPMYHSEHEPPLQLRVYRFFCGAGAYNERHVYLTWTSETGVAPVWFARPTFVVDYVEGDEAASLDGAYSAIAVTGMSARAELVNSRFDPATGAVREWSCWRGLCDASSRGTWMLDDEGAFRLVTYDIDPSYDGEVNLVRLIDFGTPIPVDLSAPMPAEQDYFQQQDE